MRNNDSTSPDESESDTSAESAAVARGAARTAATSTRGIVGRLPVQSTSSSVGLSVKNIPRLPKRAPRMRASSPRGSIPRSTPKIRVPKSHIKVPKSHANTIAKASDRASKGFDIISSMEDANVDNNNVTKKSMQIRISQYIQQISSFGKVFVTNTILGMAVFATQVPLLTSCAHLIHRLLGTCKDEKLGIAGRNSSIKFLGTNLPIRTALS